MRPSASAPCHARGAGGHRGLVAARVALIAGLGALALAAAAQPVDPETGEAQLEALAEEARKGVEGLSYEEFRDQTLYLPETGKYYVSGDTPIRNEKLLREFWEQNVRGRPDAPSGETPEFAILNVGGLDQFWGEPERHRLTYCVSTGFGARHPAVAAEMEAAAAAWEAVADLDFIHVPSEDVSCDASNPRVMFDVRPVDAGGQFLAAAFFPNDPRPARNVVIDPSSFALDPNDRLTLRGILRHEIGHTIGARHEHTRPEAGACFEDNDWRGVTDYDAFSVMHYPQCNGQGDWSLRLTANDQNGVACIYGPARDFVIDTAICAPLDASGTAATESFGPFAIAQDETQMIGQFPVRPGTPFRAVMTGDGEPSGDPDLYLKFDGPALISSFDCRPFTAGADETCDVEVPDGRSTAFVSVHGYTDGRFAVEVTSTRP